MSSPGNAGTPSPPRRACSFDGCLRRQSKLSPEEIDQLLEQSAKGVEDLRKTLNKVFRLPRYSIRLR